MIPSVKHMHMEIALKPTCRQIVYRNVLVQIATVGLSVTG